MARWVTQSDERFLSCYRRPLVVEISSTCLVPASRFAVIHIYLDSCSDVYFHPSIDVAAVYVGADSIRPPFPAPPSSLDAWFSSCIQDSTWLLARNIRTNRL
jgi:hypothetical protein